MYTFVVNELKDAHHLLQELANPLDLLVTEFRMSPAWQEKPLGTNTVEAIRPRWGAVLRKFYLIERFALTMKSSEARSLFNLLTRLKKDFEASLNDSKPVGLYGLLLELQVRYQGTLDIIDDLMLEQFDQIDRITKQISRSISDDPTQS